MEFDTHELVTAKIEQASGIAWALRELCEREDENRGNNALWAVTDLLDEAKGLLEKAWRAQKHSRIDSEVSQRGAA